MEKLTTQTKQCVENSTTQSKKRKVYDADPLWDQYHSVRFIPSDSLSKPYILSPQMKRIWFEPKILRAEKYFSIIAKSYEEATKLWMERSGQEVRKSSFVNVRGVQDNLMYDMARGSIRQFSCQINIEGDQRSILVLPRQVGNDCYPGFIQRDYGEYGIIRIAEDGYFVLHSINLTNASRVMEYMSLYVQNVFQKLDSDEVYGIIFR